MREGWEAGRAPVDATWQSKARAGARPVPQQASGFVVRERTDRRHPGRHSHSCFWSFRSSYGGSMDSQHSLLPSDTFICWLLHEVIHNVTQPTIPPDSSAIRNDWLLLTTHVGMCPCRLSTSAIRESLRAYGMPHDYPLVRANSIM